MKFDLVFSNAVDNFKSKFERVVELYVLTLPRSGTQSTGTGAVWVPLWGCGYFDFDIIGTYP